MKMLKYMQYDSMGQFHNKINKNHFDLYEDPRALTLLRNALSYEFRN